MTDRFHRYPEEDLVGAKVHRRRLDRLERQSVEQLAAFVERRRCALALSYGKDSMVCLDLLHRHGLIDQVKLVMWNAIGIEPDETRAFRDHVLACYPFSAETAYVETYPDEITLDLTLQAVDMDARHPTAAFVLECLEKPRWRTMDEHEIDGTILGLRQDESRGRRMNIARQGTEYWNQREIAEICLPVARWTTRDIYEYTASRGVPLHPIYHRLPALGFDRDRVRLSSSVDVSQRSRGQHVALRRLYPETFAAIARRIPAIRDYA